MADEVPRTTHPEAAIAVLLVVMLPAIAILRGAAILITPFAVPMAVLAWRRGATGFLIALLVGALVVAAGIAVAIYSASAG